MKLYVTTTSPFVRKVLVTAHELGLTDAIERRTLRPSPLAANVELSKANPINKIPALILDDGSALYDSRVICEYLDSISQTPGGIVPLGGPDRWRVLRRHALADGIIEAGVQAFYERAQRPEAHRWQAWIDGQVQKVNQGLDALSQEAGAFEAGAVDLGLIGAGCAIEWLRFREVVDPLEGRPALAKWYAAFSERPSMKATVPHA